MRYECTKCVKNSSLHECARVVEDRRENTVTMSNSSRPHQIIEDPNILIIRQLILFVLNKGVDGMDAFFQD